MSVRGRRPDIVPRPDVALAELPDHLRMSTAILGTPLLGLFTAISLPAIGVAQAGS